VSKEFPAGPRNQLSRDELSPKAFLQLGNPCFYYLLAETHHLYHLRLRSYLLLPLPAAAFNASHTAAGRFFFNFSTMNLLVSAPFTLNSIRRSSYRIFKLVLNVLRLVGGFAFTAPGFGALLLLLDAPASLLLHSDSSSGTTEPTSLPSM